MHTVCYVSNSCCGLTESQQRGLHLGFGVEVFVVPANGRRLEVLPWILGGTQTVGKWFDAKDLNNAEMICSPIQVPSSTSTEAAALLQCLIAVTLEPVGPAPRPKQTQQPQILTTHWLCLCMGGRRTFWGWRRSVWGQRKDRIWEDWAQEGK